jgi:protein-L-isoaspartate(D-aspartate) O-methyltransferase
MADFESTRANMLEGQVRTNDVSDKPLQGVIMDLPREQFVPKALRSVAYTDVNLEIGDARHLMRPRAFSKLMQAASVKESDLALVIGCGTGYSAAVLGKLCDSVVALEADEAFEKKATGNLEELEIDNVAVVNGPLSIGLADQGPYDVIFVDGALEARSGEIEAQLNDGGRMAVILQDGPIGRATIITRDGDRFTATVFFDASVPLLPGFEREGTFVF